MRIITLTLKNFKGIRDFVLDVNRESVSVFGDNATGKSTLFDSFLWLLFDKDSQNKKDFKIKTLDGSGKVIPAIDHEVEGVFKIGTRRLTLRKVYAEKYTKKRGSAKSEFTGHITDYFIDGIPVKKAEYEDRISEIVKEDIFKLLTSPTYFNEQLHWQDRRKILLEICGDISDEEIISSDRALAKLPGILQGRKLEDHRKVIASKRKQINDELEKIPVRIDEAQRSLSDVVGIDAAGLPAEIAKLKVQQQEKQQELARIESGGEAAEKRRQLREIEGEILRIKNEHRAKVDGQVDEKRKLLGEADDRADELKFNIGNMKKKIKNDKSSLLSMEQELIILRDTWNNVNANTFEYQQDCTCPTCGQALPEEQLTAAREKALAAFNREKAEQLEKITATGKTTKASADAIKTEICSLAEKISAIEGQLIGAEKESADIKAEIESLRNQTAPIDIYAHTEKVKEIELIERDIYQLQINSQAAVNSAKIEINEIGVSINSLKDSMLKIKQYKVGQVRIDELKAQEKALAAEFENLEEELYLTNQFIRTKVAMLEEKINSRFKYARFKLFDQQINGGLTEVCETTYQGVPYSGGLNNAARINVGLDIINTLSNYYDFSAPIFVDNAEAVVETIPTRGQTIKLVVSGSDKNLRVEVENSKEAV